MPRVLLRSLAPLPAVACVVAGAVALWFRFNASPPGFGLEFPSDFVFYFYPLTARVAERLAAGELPLWDPTACAGLPLLATLQVAALYPGTWLALLLPAEQALVALMFVETLLGALFMYMFLRARAATRAAAVVGGFLFVFGCLLGQSFWPAALSTLLWLPWLFLCVERLAQTWRWRWWSALASGVALQLLAGFPQYLVYTMYMLAPFAGVRLLESLRAGARTLRQTAVVAIGVASAVALGAGVAGIQLLPTLELVAESSRAAQLTPKQTHYLGKRASVAGFLGNAIDPSPRNIALGHRGGTGYLGIATLLLVATGLVTGWRSAMIWFWFVIGSAGLLLSQGWVGWTAPLHALYAALPTGGMFRTPARLQLLPLFAAIAVAVRGLDSLGAAATPRRMRWTALAAASGVAAIASIWGGPGATWRALAALFAIALALAANDASKLASGARLLLVGMIVLDALLATAPFGSLRAPPIEWARRVHLFGHTVLAPEQASRLEPPEHARADWHPLGPPIAAGPLAQVYRVSCYEPLRPKAWHEFQALSRKRAARAGAEGPVATGAFEDVAGLARSLVPRSLMAMTPALRDRLYSDLRQRFEAGAPPAPTSSPVATAILVENEDVLPRAYVVHDFEVTPLEVALERVLDGSHDFHASVLLDREPGRWTRGAPARTLEPAVIRSLEPERVEIDAAPSDAGLLVLSDTFYPGWRATVDGSPVEILRANGLFRAVRIPAGPHRVVFEYAPRSLRRGAWLSAVSLLALASVPLVSHRMHRRRAALGAALAITALAGCWSPVVPLARPPRPSALPAHGVGAHRGASATHPENTAAAIRAAVEAGAQQIEIDVRLTSDGALVLMHDARVDRTTDGEGEVAELSQEEILALDAGAKHGIAFRGERVPTLEEALTLVPPDRWLNLDLKGGARLGLAALRRVEEARALAHVVFAAKPEAAEAIRRAQPSAWICDTQRQRSRGRYIERAAARGADFVQLRRDQGRPTADEIARARLLGLRVNYCCAADSGEVEALWQLGVDFPLTNDPAAALERAATDGGRSLLVR